MLPVRISMTNGGTVPVPPVLLVETYGPNNNKVSISNRVVAASLAMMQYLLCLVCTVLAHFFTVTINF
jgi:hypothetical protein